MLRIEILGVYGTRNGRSVKMTTGDWKPKPGDRVVRHPRQEQISPTHISISTRRTRPRAFATPLVLIYTFLIFIFAGTILLSMPFSHEGDGFADLMDALFTATSAVTVTGLVVKDTATYWSPVGQALIMIMIFIGGLSFMTLATFLLILIGRRLSLMQRLMARDSFQTNQLGGLVRLTVLIVLAAVAIQFVGFIALAWRFSVVYESPAEAIWHALFQAISAFNGAGFDTITTGVSLSRFQTDVIVLTIIGMLIFIGSISYLVMVDVVRIRRFSKFTLNTKLVLLLTLFLTFIGAFVFFLAEYSNPDTIGTLSAGNKAVVATFESISGRTAGFTTVHYGKTAQHTNFFFTVLMFIGGASASVAGGIKINTIAVLLIAVTSTISGRGHASVFGRQIPDFQVQRAIAVVVMGATLVFLLALLLTISERDFAFIDLLFEVVSAFGTSGLSTGLTSDLSRWGQLILIVSMFLGRIGPFTLVLLMTQRGEPAAFEYARERVTIA